VLHRVALARILPHVGDVPGAELRPEQVAAAVAALHAAGKARGSIAKSLAALRQALDHAGIDPNPARDRRVKLPREDRRELDPPTAGQVEAALACCAPRYRLPLLVLEATGMRVGELEALTWGDVDERAARVRVSARTAKTRRARWVQVPADLFTRMLALVPREDRDAAAPVFAGAEQARMRTELGRACKAAGVPRFGLHDLRHRRLSLWHRDGVPIREVAHRAGHARASVTLDVYAHVLTDDREVDAAAIFA
jgi:integrase